ncbi:MAG: hypothetical protein WDZ63_04735 [Burkholderiales bacterium]
MSILVARVLATVAGAATVCAAIATSGHARDPDIGGMPDSRTDREQWRSGLSVPRDPCVKQSWTSRLVPVDPHTDSGFPARYALAGLQDAHGNRCDPSPDVRDAAVDAYNAPRDPAATRRGAGHSAR